MQFEIRSNVSWMLTGVEVWSLRTERLKQLWGVSEQEIPLHFHTSLLSLLTRGTSPAFGFLGSLVRLHKDVGIRVPGMFKHIRMESVLQ